MLQIRRSEERGAASFGWLEARHTFSFGQYDAPEQRGFSDLLVINDDRIQPGKGFGTHPHRDMEIFTYVLEGALEHADSMGTGSVIRPGDVQMMSAGSGIRHSEFNPSNSEPLHLLQIWIVPNRTGVTPRYQQAHFPEHEKRGQFRMIISPKGDNGALSVYQEARVYAGLFDGEESTTLTLAHNRYAYIHVARGSAEIQGMLLHAGDGARVRDEQKISIKNGCDAEVLVFDLRQNEWPQPI